MTKRRRATIIVLLALLLALPTALLVSETALRLVADYATRAVAGLELEGVRGRLLTGVSADRLRWANDAASVAVEAPAARWRLWPALTGRLHLETLTADAVTVELAARDGVPTARARRALPEIELPVVVRVGSLTVGRVSVVRDGGPLFEARDVHAETLFAGPREFSVARVAAHGAPVTASASFAVQPSGTWPMTVTANGTLDLAGKPSVTAGLDAVGALGDAFDLTLRVASDGIAVFEGRVSDVLNAPRLDGRLALDDVALEPWSPALTGVRFAGIAQLDGGYENLAATVRGTVRTPAWPAAALDAEVNWGHRLLGVRRLRLTAEGIEGVLDASGHADWTGATPAGAVRTAWQALHWPPAADGPWRSADGELALTFADHRGRFDLDAQFGDGPDGRVSANGALDWSDPAAVALEAVLDWLDLALFNVDSARGRASLSGTLDDWVADVRASVTPPAVEALLVDARLAGDRTQFSATPLRAEGFGGTATGAATVSWADDPHVKGRLFVDGFDTARLPPYWRGTVNGFVDVEVTGTRWSAVLGDGVGRVRDRALAISGALHGDGGVIERLAVDVGVGDARAAIEGRWSPTVDLAWRIDAADVAALVPGARGRVQGRGEVRGDASTPALSFDFDGAAMVSRWPFHIPATVRGYPRRYCQSMSTKVETPVTLHSSAASWVRSRRLQSLASVTRMIPVHSTRYWPRSDANTASGPMRSKGASWTSIRD